LKQNNEKNNNNMVKRGSTTHRHNKRFNTATKTNNQPNLLANCLLDSADSANATSVCARLLLLGQTGAASFQLLQLEGQSMATSPDADQASAVAGGAAALGTGANDATTASSATLELNSVLDLNADLSGDSVATSAVARLLRLSGLELLDAKSALVQSDGDILQLSRVLGLLHFELLEGLLHTESNLLQRLGRNRHIGHSNAPRRVALEPSTDTIAVQLGRLNKNITTHENQKKKTPTLTRSTWIMLRHLVLHFSLLQRLKRILSYLQGRKIEFFFFFFFLQKCKKETYLVQEVADADNNLGLAVVANGRLDGLLDLSRMLCVPRLDLTRKTKFNYTFCLFLSSDSLTLAFHLLRHQKVQHWSNSFW
jgi:hypothetical protein